jgi:hypothetical protein
LGDWPGKHQRLPRRTNITTPTMRAISTSNGSPT